MNRTDITYHKQKMTGSAPSGPNRWSLTRSVTGLPLPSVLPARMLLVSVTLAAAEDPVSITLP